MSIDDECMQGDDLRQKNDRQAALELWLAGYFNKEVNVELLVDDASYRRYFRLQCNGLSYIVMDAPPLYENSSSFVKVAQELASRSICVPTIYSMDLEQGFLLLSDLGDDLYLNDLSESNVDERYAVALKSLLKMYQNSSVNDYQVPVFDRSRYTEEFSWFAEWYLEQWLSYTVSPKDKALLSWLDGHITEQCLLQPQVLIHYDFHSRNLLRLADGQVGVIDFQDAKLGPVTYDIVSLFTDCYIDWPREQVERWCATFQKQLLAHDLISEDDVDTFMMWFDYVVLQRHLRNLGNFARLKIIKNKPQYIQYFPRMSAYVLAVCKRYPQLDKVGQWLEPLLCFDDKAVESV